MREDSAEEAAAKVIHCESFHGELNLKSLPVSANESFANLRIIHGSLVVSGTQLAALPQFPRLVLIHNAEGHMGLVITNNAYLRDIHGIVDSLQRIVTTKPRGYIIQNNPLLDKSIYPRWVYEEQHLISSQAGHAGIDENESQGFAIVVGVLLFFLLFICFGNVLNSGRQNLYYISDVRRMAC